MDIWNLVAERKIAEAMEEGKFDSLEGAGEPLPVEDDPSLDPAARLGNRLLRNNGFAPSWIDARNELLSAVESYKSLSEDRGARAEELNNRIREFNLSAPSARFHVSFVTP